MPKAQAMRLSLPQSSPDALDQGLSYTAPARRRASIVQVRGSPGTRIPQPAFSVHHVSPEAKDFDILKSRRTPNPVSVLPVMPLETPSLAQSAELPAKAFASPVQSLLLTPPWTPEQQPMTPEAATSPEIIHGLAQQALGDPFTAKQAAHDHESRFEAVLHLGPKLRGSALQRSLFEDDTVPITRKTNVLGDSQQVASEDEGYGSEYDAEEPEWLRSRFVLATPPSPAIIRGRRFESHKRTHGRSLQFRRALQSTPPATPRDRSNQFTPPDQAVPQSGPISFVDAHACVQCEDLGLKCSETYPR